MRSGESSPNHVTGDSGALETARTWTVPHTIAWPGPRSSVTVTGPCDPASEAGSRTSHVRASPGSVVPWSGRFQYAHFAAVGLGGPVPGPVMVTVTD